MKINNYCNSMRASPNRNIFWTNHSIFHLRFPKDFLAFPIAHAQKKEGTYVVSYHWRNHHLEV